MLVSQKVFDMFIVLLLLSLNAHAARGVFSAKDVEANEPLLHSDDSYLQVTLINPDDTHLWDKKKNIEYRVNPLDVKSVLRGALCPDNSFLLVLKDYNDQNSDCLLYFLEGLERWMSEKQNALPGAIVEKNYLAFLEKTKGTLVVTGLRTLRFPKRSDEMFACQSPLLRRSRKMKGYYELSVCRTFSETPSLSSYAVQSEGVHHCGFMNEAGIDKLCKIHDAKCSIL